MRLYGPGTDSGTFDFFTAQINGKEDVSRSDFSASEDDNVIVQGVGGDRGALGYFGLSYAEENASQAEAARGRRRARLCHAELEDGAGRLLHRRSRDRSSSYVKHAAAQRPEVAVFLHYLVANTGAIPESARFVPLTLCSARRPRPARRAVGGMSVAPRLEASPAARTLAPPAWGSRDPHGCSRSARSSA